MIIKKPLPCDFRPFPSNTSNERDHVTERVAGKATCSLAKEFFVHPPMGQGPGIAYLCRTERGAHSHLSFPGPRVRDIEHRAKFSPR